jgi:3-deoxy-D-manno-octulosonate 8-phosphate phosphatase (KDO 8-P phosphatase)
MAQERDIALQRAAAIRLAVFDVDGVMTDGRISYSENGDEIKSFHSHDGLGLKALLQNGIAVAVITARQSGIVQRRMAELGIERVLQGRRDKAQALDELQSSLGCGDAETAFTGDDLVDWSAMGRCGLRCAPANAHAFLLERVDYRCRQPGGQGAVREVCELILEGQGKLTVWLESFS